MRCVNCPYFARKKNKRKRVDGWCMLKIEKDGIYRGVRGYMPWYCPKRKEAVG